MTYRRTSLVAFTSWISVRRVSRQQLSLAGRAASQSDRLAIRVPAFCEHFLITTKILSSSPADNKHEKGATVPIARRMLGEKGLLSAPMKISPMKITECPRLPLLKGGLGSGDHVFSWLTNRKCLERFGGPGRVRTVDLFHAMEARSQLRHRPTS